MINQYQSIDLDNAAYQAVNLGSGYGCFYLIGITTLTDIKSVTFSVAVDSGVSGKPLVLNNITLELSGEVSGTVLTGYPQNFYLKPVQVLKTNGEALTEGEFDIEVNINPVKFN